MRGYSVLLFLLALPILGALGHDIYITYYAKDFDEVIAGGVKPMKFSDVGYLFTHYAPDFYNWIKDNVSPKTWKDIITPILEQSSSLIAAVPFLVTSVILLILKLLNLPPFGDGVSRRFKKGGFGFGSGDRKQGRFKYNRK